ncbi:transposase [Burkholderia pseudomallei]|nr:transposase [Burkholderia pseudomallei]VCN58759.1 transposase [Burkholderia pseudomallei]VCN67117.1 transposase [Burkholderia pseudomallei]VCN74781.1 transposase [Burkholderia pseudomallei]VCN76431.1 transposase [Burkholderia pseudomallei]
MIIAMYARGRSMRAIQGFLLEMYRLEVSHRWTSSVRVTEAVIDKACEWQQRPLEFMYPVVFLDALRVKIRNEGAVRNKAMYLVTCLISSGHFNLGERPRLLQLNNTAA